MVYRVQMPSCGIDEQELVLLVNDDAGCGRPGFHLGKAFNFKLYKDLTLSVILAKDMISVLALRTH